MSDRDSRPWVARTHYVTVVVDDELSPSRADNAARNAAAAMGYARGSMVTAVRIVAVEL